MIEERDSPIASNPASSGSNHKLISSDLTTFSRELFCCIKKHAKFNRSNDWLKFAGQSMFSILCHGKHALLT